MQTPNLNPAALAPEDRKSVSDGFRKRLAECQANLSLLADSKTIVEAALADPEIDTPNDQGLPPYSVSDAVHNILLCYPGRAFADLLRLIDPIYSSLRVSFKPLFIDYFLALFNPVTALRVKRYRSISKICDQIDRIKNIISNHKDAVDASVNISSFITLVSYLHVLKPDCSSTLFRGILPILNSCISACQSQIRGFQIIVDKASL